MYCGRSAIATGVNIASFGLGNFASSALSKSLVGLCDPAREADAISGLTFGNAGIVAALLMDTSERPDTYARHPSHTDPEPR